MSRKSANDNSKDGWSAGASGDGWSASARGDKEGGCCYAPSTPVHMSDGTVQTIDSLKKGDRILSLIKGKLETVFVKKITRSYNLLYNLPYGHKPNIIQATADHKFMTRRGGIRVDHLRPEDDFVYMLQSDGTFSWVSIGTISLDSRLMKRVVEIRTHDSGNCIVGSIIGYNYSQMRQLREFLNKLMI